MFTRSDRRPSCRKTNSIKELNLTQSTDDNHAVRLFLGPQTVTLRRLSYARKVTFNNDLEFGRRLSNGVGSGDLDLARTAASQRLQGQRGLSFSRFDDDGG